MTASKFGGAPYLPAGAQAPTNESGKPLGMIAQINCAELPKNELYPKTGILQFWIDSGEEEGDENWGFNANDIANQANIRVIYYPQVGEAAPAGHPAVTAARSEDWPIYPPEAELALTFKKKHESLSDTSREFEARFVHRWNEKHPEQTINEVYEIDRLHDGENIAYDLTDSTEYHKLGGYPSFVQSDPRENNPELQEYTVNLLTIASEEAKNDGDGDIMWGDMGTANWLITPQQLADRDFSQVLFEWSCG
ncbi:hypothetical protein HMPREF2609_06885 [Rothia sp. HMSC058E10]|nr:hypothetical protein HMPREF2609_06885 [Rothia sp. HMSC058E10]